MALESSTCFSPASGRKMATDAKSLQSLPKLIGDRKPPSPETICGEAMTLKSSQPQAKTWARAKDGARRSGDLYTLGG